MRRSISGSLALVLALALGASGCDNGDTTTGPTPTDPAPTVTETFAGTLTPNGAAVFTFGVTGTGSVTATLRNVLPTSSVQLGLGIGVWNGILCQVILSNDKAQQDTTVTGQVNAAGTLCARIYDVGQLTAPTTFEVVVIHP
jgi:hypothetical protein